MKTFKLELETVYNDPTEQSYPEKQSSVLVNCDSQEKLDGVLKKLNGSEHSCNSYMWCNSFEEVDFDKDAPGVDSLETVFTPWGKIKKAS